ncbi:MAG: hypothetical protein IPF53_00715 [Blastocatellia bacterium]|nr:hypothetical protein [Blastocatellia bacterium]MBK6425181.1 hypothetical protein [Blastocatellia bacterium]
MIWLGERRGNLSDWVTQQWVKVTGRSVTLASHPWLEGPVGPTSGIGVDFFTTLAAKRGLSLVRGAGVRGLLGDMEQLRGVDFDPVQVNERVANFYTSTSAYDLDAWAEWSAGFRPFGWLLALLFSRRLRQLNIPLSGLDTSGGMTSEVLQLVEPATGDVRLTAWVRELLSTGRVLYAGTYSPCAIPGLDGPCLKVVFPLPNGNAMVIMRPVLHADGSMTVASTGRKFGDPGFYFTVHDGDGRMWARYVRTLREAIHVYPAEDGRVRADHELTIFGMTFLRLHYRLAPKSVNVPIDGSEPGVAVEPARSRRVS